MTLLSLSPQEITASGIPDKQTIVKPLVASNIATIIFIFISGDSLVDCSGENCCARLL